MAKKKPVDDAEVDAILKKAVPFSKHSFPTTIDAVKATEDEPLPPLPEDLQDPDVVFNRALLDQSRMTPDKPAVSQETEDELRAMAARKGGEVSPDTRELMDKDRDEAEDELNEDGNG